MEACWAPDDSYSFVSQLSRDLMESRLGRGFAVERFFNQEDGHRESLKIRRWASTERTSGERHRGQSVPNMPWFPRRLESTQKFVNILVQMAPFGPESQQPVFVSNNVCAYRYLSLVKEKHIRFIAKQQDNANTFNCIGFNMEEFYEGIQDKKPFRMAFTLEENDYNGKTSIQLVIKDIKFD